jgi:hypothetical protein
MFPIRFLLSSLPFSETAFQKAHEVAQPSKRRVKPKGQSPSPDSIRRVDKEVTQKNHLLNLVAKTK